MNVPVSVAILAKTSSLLEQQQRKQHFQWQLARNHSNVNKSIRLDNIQLELEEFIMAQGDLRAECRAAHQGPAHLGPAHEGAAEPTTSQPISVLE